METLEFTEYPASELGLLLIFWLPNLNVGATPRVSSFEDVIYELSELVGLPSAIRVRAEVT